MTLFKQHKRDLKFFLNQLDRLDLNDPASYGEVKKIQPVLEIILKLVNEFLDARLNEMKEKEILPKQVG